MTTFLVYLGKHKFSCDDPTQKTRSLKHDIAGKLGPDSHPGPFLGECRGRGGESSGALGQYKRRVNQPRNQGGVAGRVKDRQRGHKKPGGSIWGSGERSKSEGQGKRTTEVAVELRGGVQCLSGQLKLLGGIER